MSLHTISISQESYERFKHSVLESTKLKRVDINTMNLQINSLSALSFNGTVLSLTQNAQRSLMQALGVSKVLIKTLTDVFQDPKAVQAILQQIRNNAKRSKTLTLVYNVKMNIITDVYAPQAKLMSDAQYFELLEAFIAKQGSRAYLRNIDVNERGNISAVIINPDMEFKFGNIDNETFLGGATFDFFGQTLSTRFFTERLVC